MSTVLFVDDHHAFRTVFAEVLRIAAGDTVLEACTAAEAEHLLERHSGPVDVLLVEAVLLTANGWEVARRVQSTHPEMRVLFTSAESAHDLTQKRLLPYGASFLHKPFTARRLLTSLHKKPISQEQEKASKTGDSPARRTRSGKRTKPTRASGGA